MVQISVNVILSKLRDASDHHNKRFRQSAGVKDFYEYKYILGLINGLEEAEKVVMNFYKGTVEGIEKDNEERQSNGQ